MHILKPRDYSAYTRQEEALMTALNWLPSLGPDFS